MANTVNLGDKYTHRVTLRLNDEQYKFILDISEILGVSPSDYMRMSINMGLTQMKNMQGVTDVTKDTLVDSLNTVKGMVGTNNENVKTDKHDNV